MQHHEQQPTFTTVPLIDQGYLNWYKASRDGMGISLPSAVIGSLLTIGFKQITNTLEEFKMTNTNNAMVITIEMVEGASYKELQSLAKQFGIKANQKTNVLKEALLEHVTFEEVEIEPAAPSTDGFFGDDEDDSASEASAPVQQPTKEEQPVTTTKRIKPIEFIKATGLAVHYKANGKDVIVGWSTTDFRMHIWSKEKGTRFISYPTLMRQFSKLKNGVHGDIARVVKALGRIKTKPVQIMNLEQEKKANAVSRADENVNEDASAKQQPVTRELIKKVSYMLYDVLDRQPTADEVRDALQVMIA